MAKTDSAVAIEFDTPLNSNLYFTPIQRDIRGRFDINRVNEPNAGQLRSRYPMPIPGEVVEYDFSTGEGFITEPLHEERYAAIREQIEKQGMSLRKERRIAFAVDPASFAHWMGGLVQSGDAKLLSGSWPSSVPGKPKLRFHSAEQADPMDKLTAAIERQAEGQAKMLELLTAALERLAK